VNRANPDDSSKLQPRYANMTLNVASSSRTVPWVGAVYEITARARGGSRTDVFLDSDIAVRAHPLPKSPLSSTAITKPVGPGNRSCPPRSRPPFIISRPTSPRRRNATRTATNRWPQARHRARRRSAQRRPPHSPVPPVTAPPGRTPSRRTRVVKHAPYRRVRPTSRQSDLLSAASPSQRGLASSHGGGGRHPAGSARCPDGKPDALRATETKRSSPPIFDNRSSVRPTSHA